MPGRIPDRWEDYDPLGSPIEGTRFITFKVPLKEKLVYTLPKEDQFTPGELIGRIQEQGHSLGLVVDLTNTNRYYSSQDLTQSDVKYAKIYTEGHVVPSKKVRSKFFSVVERFLNDAANKDKLVGVHCTHGVNRTGYLVCRYMIDKLGFEPDDALAAYSKGRGYPVERENYIEDLKNGKRNESLDDEEEDEEEEQQQDLRRRIEGNNSYRGQSNDNFRHRHRPDQGFGPHRPAGRPGPYGHHNQGPYSPPQSNYRPAQNRGWGASLQRQESPRSFGHNHHNQDRGKWNSRGRGGGRRHEDWNSQNGEFGGGRGQRYKPYGQSRHADSSRGGDNGHWSNSTTPNQYEKAGWGTTGNSRFTWRR